MGKRKGVWKLKHHSKGLGGSGMEEHKGFGVVGPVEMLLGWDVEY